MATKLNSRFLAAESKSFFNSSEWTPQGDPVALEDIWSETRPGQWAHLADGPDTECEVILQEFEDGGESLRIRVPFDDGSTLDLKLSGRSSLEEGDTVKASTIKGQLLSKIGQNDILRYDGELAA